MDSALKRIDERIAERSAMFRHIELTLFRDDAIMDMGAVACLEETERDALENQFDVIARGIRTKDEEARIRLRLSLYEKNISECMEREFIELQEHEMKEYLDIYSIIL